MTEWDGVPERTVASPFRRTRIARELWWGALTIAFAVFIGTGRVSTYLGAKGRGTSDVWDVWRRLAGDLPGGNSDLLEACYVLALIAFVGGTLVALWLALSADGADETTGRSSSDTP